MAAIWPPITIVEFGESLRIMRHISRTLAMFTMIEEIPMTPYGCAVISRSKSFRVGKSRTVQGAEIFAWISIMPQERWNMRSEKLPCAL